MTMPLTRVYVTILVVTVTILVFLSKNTFDDGGGWVTGGGGTVCKNGLYPIGVSYIGIFFHFPFPN